MPNGRTPNMNECKYEKNNLNAVGELFAVLANKRSFHRVLQMSGKTLLVIIVIIVVIMSLLADIFSNGDAISFSLLVQAWTCED